MESTEVPVAMAVTQCLINAGRQRCGQCVQSDHLRVNKRAISEYESKFIHMAAKAAADSLL